MITPIDTASAIDRHDRTMVTTDARSSDGRYRRAASQRLTVATLADVSRPMTAGTGTPASSRSYSFG